MTNPTTKDDKRVAAALAIRSVASTMKSFDQPLVEAIETLGNPNSTKVQKSKSAKALKAMQNSIAALIAVLVSNVKILDPIPSLDYVHSRQKKQPLMDISNKRNAPVPEPNPPAPKRVKKTRAVLPSNNCTSNS